MSTMMAVCRYLLLGVSIGCLAMSESLAHGVGFVGALATALLMTLIWTFLFHQEYRLGCDRGWKRGFADGQRIMVDAAHAVADKRIRELLRVFVALKDLAVATPNAVPIVEAKPGANVAYLRGEEGEIVYRSATFDTLEELASGVESDLALRETAQ